MGNRVVVTGGSGYIGSRLLQFLIDKGFSIYCITRPSTDLNKLPNHERVRFLEYDGSIESIQKELIAFAPDAIFHLAAVGNAVHDSAMINSLISSNIALGTHLLEILSKLDSGMFINTGTFWQYDKGVADYSPNSLYAATKQAFQDIIRYYSNVYSLSAVTLILYDVYGDGDPRGKLFTLLSQVAKSSSTIAMSPGEQKIIPVYIDDVVNAFYLTYQMLKAGTFALSDKYYVVGDSEYSIKEVVDAFQKVSQKKINVIWGKRPYREREIMMPYVGEKLPRWHQKVVLEEGLQKVWLDHNGL